jgi:hypothetical protein
MLLATDEHVMLLAVKDWLTASFAATPAQVPDAGAEAELRRNLPEPDDNTGAPSIVLWLQNDIRSQWAGANGRERDCSINLECRANDFAGSMEGLENAEAAHIKMARGIRAFNLDAIENTYPGLTTIQVLGENSGAVSMRLFLTYSEI